VFPDWVGAIAMLVAAFFVCAVVGLLLLGLS